MPWEVTGPMELKKSLIELYLSGIDSMSALCRRYGVSRKTGYKWLNRYNAEGYKGLCDRRGQRPDRGSVFSEEDWSYIVDLKKAHPGWGPEKIYHSLNRQLSDFKLPSPSSIKAYFKKHGLSRDRKVWCGQAGERDELAPVVKPGGTWCIDFKGWYLSADGVRCQPLTLSDAYSRYLLLCRRSPGDSLDDIRSFLVEVFEKHGCPERMRSDNGPPFGSAGWRGLNRMSVWLIKHGIIPEKIPPGQPQYNGRHERIHRTLNEEVIKFSRHYSCERQDESYERFRFIYNYERPHQALKNRCPGDVYKVSEREYKDEVAEYEYPVGFDVARVSSSGYLRIKSEKYYLSESLSGEKVGVTVEKEPRMWFRNYYLGELLSLNKRRRG